MQEDTFTLQMGPTVQEIFVMHWVLTGAQHQPSYTATAVLQFPPDFQLSLFEDLETWPGCLGFQSNR